MTKMAIWAKRFGLFLSLCFLFVTDCDRVIAASVEEFYKGKTMTFLVPASPGGGYDIWARLLAPYISKIVGLPMVVINKPGAGGLIGVNYMYTEVKPDGLTLSINLPFSVLMDEYLGNKGVKYESLKFKWLARASFDDYVVAAGKTSPNRSFDTIKKASKVKFGSTSRTTPNGANVTAFCLAANLQSAKMIVGYAGSSETRIAMLKGEIDLTSGSVGTQLNLIKSGDLIPIAIVGNQRSKDLPEVPTIYELNPNMLADNKKWVDIIVKLSVLGRGLFTAPGVPEDRFNFLVGAVKKALHDRSFIKKVNDAGFTVNYLSPADYVKEFQAIRLTPEERVKFMYILQEKYPD